MPEGLQLQFGKLVKRLRDRAGSDLALEAAIARSNGNQALISRRKIASLVAGHARTLKFDELQALDNYLNAEGGIATVLGQRTLLHLLAREERILFVFGAKRRDSTSGEPVVSWWDVRSLVQITRVLHRLGTSPPYEIADVPSRPEEARHLAAGRVGPVFSGDAWYDQAVGKAPASVVSFASPLANHCSEVLLARFFGVLPFRRGTAATLPFAFVWSPQAFAEVPSAFAEDAGIHSRSALTNRSSVAMRVGSKIHVIEDKNGCWTTYGILAAQRRRGSVSVVAAGLTAHGTYAATQLIETLAFALPEPPGEGDGPVAWLAIEVEVDHGSRPHGAPDVGITSDVMPDENGHEVRLWEGAS